MGDHIGWLMVGILILIVGLVHIGPKWWRASIGSLTAVVMMGYLLMSGDGLAGAILIGFTGVLAYQLGHVRPQDDPRPPDPWRHFSGGEDE